MSFSYTVKTQKAMNDVIEEITSNLTKIQFGVLGTLDFKEIFAKKGVDIGSNVNALHIAALVFIVLVLITSPIWIEKLVSWYNKRKE